MADGEEKKVMVDEIAEEPIRYEVENLKIALKAANNALKVDQDRRIYEAMVNEAKTRIGKFKKTGSKISRIIVYFAKLNDEHGTE